MSFQSLGLSPSILSTLAKLNYLKPTPIQQAAIPAVFANKDLLAGAQTGTGKTAAFALPLLQKIADSKLNPPHLHDSSQHQAKVLVLTPTRELAQQVYQSFTRYGESLPVSSVVAYGGASINTQIENIEQGVDILIATPGRLLELIMKEHIDLSSLQTLVLDEADRMLDMGFIIDIRRILKKLPEQRQTLFFSATFNDDVFTLSNELLHQPELVEVGERNTAAAKVEQTVYTVDKSKKSGLISYLIGSKNWQQVLIFTRTKQGADALTKEIQKDGIDAKAIHGDKSQGARDRVLTEFKNGTIRALVATDVAARGLDIEQLAYVINHELPYNAEDYIHRIGRTGRAGKAGTAISLVTPAENYLLDEIEKLLNISLMPQWYPGFEPDVNNLEISNRSTLSKKAKRSQALGQPSKNKKNRRRR